MQFEKKFIIFILLFFSIFRLSLLSTPSTISYNNQLIDIPIPDDFLEDYQEYIDLFPSLNAALGQPLVVNQSPSLEIMSWRSSYNFRGIILIPQYFNRECTAVIVMHPWSVNEEAWGLKVPEPHGVCFDTPDSLDGYKSHMETKIQPFIDAVRPYVKHIAFSLPGSKDTLRKNIYLSGGNKSIQAQKSLQHLLDQFNYFGYSIPTSLSLNPLLPITDYFRLFPPLDASDYYNGKGFWNLPIPLHTSLLWNESDLFFFDGEGYESIKRQLKKKGIKNILLCGYALNLCIKGSVLGYENLKKDFNVLIVADACLSSSRATPFTPLLTFSDIFDCSLNNLMTQTSWVKPQQNTLSTFQNKSLSNIDGKKAQPH